MIVATTTARLVAPAKLFPCQIRVIGLGRSDNVRQNGDLAFPWTNLQSRVHTSASQKDSDVSRGNTPIRKEDTKANRGDGAGEHEEWRSSLNAIRPDRDESYVNTGNDICRTDVKQISQAVGTPNQNHSQGGTERSCAWPAEYPISLIMVGLNSETQYPGVTQQKYTGGMTVSCGRAKNATQAYYNCIARPSSQGKF
jgi:hypothetical protein